MPSVERLSPLPCNKGFLVIWQWADDAISGTFDSFKKEDLLQEGDISTDSDLTDVEDDVLDTISCKCIGVTQNKSYQQALEAAYKQLQKGIDTDVQLVPEPNNPYDSKAISFQCHVNQSWKTFGYIARELCDCIHDAIAQNCIVEVKFFWVKYKVLHTTGPGYYAAVNITRRGEWPPIARKCANTMR